MEKCETRLRVNQIEFSLLQCSPLLDSIFDQCITEDITPLAWSPLDGGQLADGAGDLLRSQREYQPPRVVPLLDEMAARHGGSRSGIALAWLLRHPAGVVPNIGTTNVDRIKDAVRAESIELSRAAWYALVTAAEPGPLA